MDPLTGGPGARVREAFAAAHPDVALLQADDPRGVENYLHAPGLLAPEERVVQVAHAGAGNMNLTLRVTTSTRSLIVKQGRPWVEKYPDIAAPWDRTAVEGEFYLTVMNHPAVAGHLPALLRFDQHNRVLVMEDVSPARDCTALYATGEIASVVVAALLDWLERLAEVRVEEWARSGFANRAMRALNHEHIFRLPLAEHNGLDLDAFTPGLARAALDLQRHAAYRDAVDALGSRYLADGPSLVHGDYFPGSWLASMGGMHIIDPEFCFLGAREFDYGVMLAHFALGRCHRAHGEAVLAAASAAHLDTALVAGFAGVEIMRRLIGVAQLPLPYGLDAKEGLLKLSAHLVLGRVPGFEPWPSE